MVDKKMRKMKIGEEEDSKSPMAKKDKVREYAKKEEHAVALLGLDVNQGEEE
jgi:hypothetical protein